MTMLAAHDRCSPSDLNSVGSPGARRRRMVCPRDVPDLAVRRVRAQPRASPLEPEVGLEPTTCGLRNPATPRVNEQRFWPPLLVSNKLTRTILGPRSRPPPRILGGCNALRARCSPIANTIAGGPDLEPPLGHPSAGPPRSSSRPRFRWSMLPEMLPTFESAELGADQMAGRPRPGTLNEPCLAPCLWTTITSDTGSSDRGALPAKGGLPRTISSGPTPLSWQRRSRSGKSRRRRSSKPTWTESQRATRA